jgi:beta-alanine--pyruvate transaminase
MVANRKQFGNMLTGVDHLSSTYDRSKQAFTKGEPEWGAHLADELTRLDQPARCLHHCRRHRRAGGRLHRHPAAAQGLPEEAARDHGPARHPLDLRRGHHRLRRLGHCFASERYGVEPDMITFAKGVTNAAVPMAGVWPRRRSTTPS